MTLASLVLLGTILTGDSAPDSVLVADSTRAMGTPVDTSRVRPDSLTRFYPLQFVGSIDRSIADDRTVVGDRFPRLSVYSLGDALALLPGVYIRDQQSPGQYNQLNAGGVDWRGTAVLMDGRSLNDPASGTYNLNLFPAENVGRVEYVSGAEAFLYGLNSTGASVNLVTRDFDSNIPRTKLLFSVSSYSSESSDASFHQNISRRMNVSFGLRAQNTDGRFDNSDMKTWNLRGKVRFHILPNLSFYVSEIYTSTRTGLFGGVSVERTPPGDEYSPILATVVNPYAYEKLTRHDLTATLAGRITDDSTAATRLTVHYSNSLREYRDGVSGTSGFVETIKDDQRSSWAGVTLSQELTFGPQHFLAGVGFEERQIEGSPQMGRRRTPTGAAWLKDRIVIGGLLELSLFGRADRYGDRHAIGAGTRLGIHAAEWITFSAGLSRSRRFPTAVELYWSDSTISRPAIPSDETHTVIEAGASARTGVGAIELSVYRRTIEQPILLQPFGSAGGMSISNGDTYAVTGLDLRVALHIWMLTLEGTGSVTKFSTDATRDRYPWIFGQGGLYFDNPLFDGHLDIKAGIRGSGQIGQAGELFNAQRLSYSRNIGRQPGTGAKLDLVLLARIGSAEVHVIWENVTSSSYFSTPYFPALDRAVRFGVSWSFIN